MSKIIKVSDKNRGRFHSCEICVLFMQDGCTTAPCVEKKCYYVKLNRIK
jgi:hypothetical protein